MTAMAMQLGSAGMVYLTGPRISRSVILHICAFSLDFR